MRIKILFLLSLFFLASCKMNFLKKHSELDSDAIIPIKKGVIFTARKANQNQKDFKYVSIPGSYWTPNELEVNQSEHELLNYLSKDNYRDKSKILNNLTDYKRQYVGYLDKKNKLIFINFLCKDYWQEDNSWKSNFILILDGGSCFFQVRYNIDKKTFEDLHINGES